MMPRPRKPVRKKNRPAHLKYAAISVSTLVKYRQAVASFFTWKKRCGYPTPSSFAGLDDMLAEITNESYLEREPMYKAANALCGLNRLYPRCRKHLDTSHMLYN